MNLSDKGVKGTVRMELFNPETEKVFYSQKQKFDVKGGETGHVNFTFEVSDRLCGNGMPDGSGWRYLQ